ncbi:UNVERIFIED_CONTAM: aspartate/methionine/tyrosine aminotransferase [Streptomyces canus]
MDPPFEGGDEFEGANCRCARPTAGCPTFEELDRLVSADTKLIAVDNPSYPTGALIDEAGPARIVKIAERVGAWVLCDEVYRGRRPGR